MADAQQMDVIGCYGIVQYCEPEALSGLEVTTQVTPPMLCC
jgi:hypothetical protein